MIGSQKVACVIPARLESTRFPRKILQNLAGRPLLQWVWQAAQRVSCFDHVVFAIDSEQTAELITSFGGTFIMTSLACQSGTDRLVEIALSHRVTADIWVNWQADEPFVTQREISTLLQSCHPAGGFNPRSDVDIWTLKQRIAQRDDISSTNVVKVVCDTSDCALYFSRHAIPFYREDRGGNEVYYKHIGLFAYTTDALEKIALMQSSDLESAERLEQLRFLQHGLRIKVHETDHDGVGIDTPQDLEKAEKYVKKHNLISVCHT